MWVVDQPFPAHRGAGLLEVDAHDNENILSDLIRERLQACGVIKCRLRIVDRAWPHYHHQTIICLFDNRLNHRT